MNIVEKMKTDWNRRASHEARYFIATEDYRNDEVFDRSGEDTAQAITSILAATPERLATYRVLDIGCGIGRVLKSIAPAVREAVGIDVSAEMVARASERLKDIPNVTTYESTGVDLGDFPDDSFDLVYSYVAFQHMPRPVFTRYLNEAHRVLRDGGSMVFQLYLGPRQEPPLGDTIALRVYDESELADGLRKSGFHIAERKLEHRSDEGLESWLIVAAPLPAIGPEPGAGEWLQEECGEMRSPLDGHLYRNLARTQLAEGARAQAVETMKRHLEFDPQDLSTALDLCALLVEEKRPDDAAAVLKHVNEVHPDYADAYVARAQLLALLGRTAEALHLHDRLCVRFPKETALHDRVQKLVMPAPVSSAVGSAPGR